MIFAYPLGLLLFLGVPLVILLHTVFRRRRPAIVPSLLLWRCPATPRQTESFFRRIRFDLVLLLRILFISLLSLALAQPELHFTRAGARHVVLIVDTSASMQATDLYPNRFARAQSEALALLDELSAARRVLVLEAAARTRVVAPVTVDRAEARRRLAGLKPQDGTTEIGEALELAAALGRPGEPVEIHLFTDGAFRSLPTLPEGQAHLTVHQVGERSRNVGITALRVRRDHYAPDRYEAFLSLHNAAEEPMVFPLDLRLDGVSFHREQVSLPPMTRRSLLIPFTRREGGLVEVEVAVADDLTVDNRAAFVIPPPQPQRVLLVTPGNVFLEQALRADRQVVLTVASPEEFPQAAAGHDVVVLDRYAPAALPPGRYLLLRSVPGNLPVEVLGEVPRPTVVDWDRSHPAMRYVNLSEVAIRQALKVRPLTGSVTLVESPLTPLVLAFNEGGTRAIFLGFDPLQSDLPLRTAFPLLISNAVHWLHPIQMEDLDLQGQAGMPVPVRADPSLQELQLEPPAGGVRRLPLRTGVAYLSDTRTSGVYRLSGRDFSRQIAINLLDDEESDLRPRLVLPPAPSGPPAGSYRDRQELWYALLFLALVVLIIEAILVWRRRAIGWFPLAIRGGAALLLIVALTAPKVERPTERLNVLFLLDTSDSLPFEEKLRAREFVRTALTFRDREDWAGLVTFAARPEVVSLPGTEFDTTTAPARGPAPRATDIGAALRMGLALLPEGGRSRMILLSDGNDSAGQLADEVLAVAQRGVEIYSVPVGSWRGGEVLVERVALPQEVKEGEPFVLRLTLWSAEETEARFTIHRNGEFLGAQKVHLSPGKNVFAYRQTLRQAGFHTYQVAVEGREDVLEENNRALGVVAVRGRPRVLLVERDQAQAEHLARALRTQQVQVEVRGPGGIPRDLPDLQRFDTVILSNVSSLRMTRRQMEMVRSYVRDAGGGLIMLGGDESFGVGGYYHTPVEEALPVTMEARQRLEVPSLAVVLVIDRSGSMDTRVGQFTKLDLAKEAAQLVVELLDRRSEIGVLAFDTTPGWVVEPKPVRDRERILGEISTVRPGGGTDMFPALKEAYQSLYQRDALLKHIIVLSDGQSAAGDFTGLIRRIARDRITVSTVAIGRDADARLLRDISRWGRGRFYFTEDPANLPRIFTLEAQLASKSAVVEEPFRAVPIQPGHEILRGIDWPEAPPLGGYVATTSKATAEVLLVSPQGDPLLAVWRYGLGRAGAFTSDAKARWGVLWLKWSGFSPFFAQLTRWTLRTAEPQEAVAEIRRHRNRGIVGVETITPTGQFVNFLEARAGVVTPEKLRRVVELTQVAPGRYEGSFPITEEGAYLVGIARRRGETMIGSELASLVVPYPSEHRSLGVNMRMLTEMGALSGGGVIGKAEEAFRLARRPSVKHQDLWPLLAVTSLVLVFLAILIQSLGAWGDGLRRPAVSVKGGEAPRGLSRLVRGRRIR